jgi:short-subunit dehydrogenase
MLGVVQAQTEANKRMATHAGRDIFQGRTAIITGASAGVGAAVARAFAACGARLMLVARGQKALKEIAAELKPVTDVHTMAMDVADEKLCAAMLKKAEFELGAVHYLVNNAGLHVRGPVEANEPDDLGAMIDVNLRAPIVLSRLALPYLRASGGGAIVNVASLAGCTPVEGAATYSASKFGLRAFTFALAEELRDSNIHIGVVSPGPIDTGFIMSQIDNVTDLTFSQPMSTAEAVAEAVLRVAMGEKVEIKMPAASGVLANVSYLFPGVRRFMLPWLEKKGRKAKAFYRARAQDGGGR